MRRDVVIAALALIALLVVSILSQKPERPTSATRSSEDYSFGGYHAWYDLLAREGIRVERFRRHHDALDGERETLIVAFPEDSERQSWSAAERDALRAWIRRGGRLIDVGETPDVPERRIEPTPAPQPTAAPKARSKGRSATRSAPASEKVYLQHSRASTGPLRGPWAALIGGLEDRGTERIVPNVRHGVQTLLADDAGALAVRYAEGHGEVIALARAAWFENRAIGRAGAARLAFLAARPPAGQVVLFDESVRGDIVEKPWYEALTAAELVALGIAALAGVLWLLDGIVPLGPAVRLRAPREPTSHEFVDAVAALYERARVRDHAREALLRDARRSLDRAPSTPENDALRARVDAAEHAPLAKDEALIAVAQLAREARENTKHMVMDRATYHRGPQRRSLRGQPGGPT